MNKNIQVQDFFHVDFSELTFPMIVVYFNPTDIPGKYVDRVFDLDKPTYTMTVRDTLKEIHETIPPRFTNIPRHPADDATVVECWI